VTIQPSNPLAIEFLKRAYPDGPWLLTAIRLDRKAIDTRTFRPGEAGEKALLAWLHLYNGERNIYWSVNPPIRDLTKKAERGDISAVHYIHVDIDPRAGEELAAERERCAALFGENLPEGVPLPTAVIFSGGGYQGFWKLETPIPINGDLALAEDAKRYNQQMELLFEGDNCHNIDRIMRLPGTINLPDERKRKKGRIPELAKLVLWNADAVYPLSRFTKAPETKAAVAKPTSFGRSPVAIDVVRLDDINELDVYGVPDRVKVVCIQGKDPDNPKTPDNSRSMWVFDCVCQLLRSNVPKEVILSILTDPAFGISESVLEKGSGAERYALRQIERAEAEVAHFERNKAGKAMQTVNNMRLALARLEVTFRYNEFSGEDYIDRPSVKKIVDDKVLIALRFEMQRQWDFLPDATTFNDLARSIALENKFHPLREYLLGLKWDGVPRIDKWLVTYGGAEDTPLNRAVGLCWLTAAVRRPLQPGVKFDEILVLESPQGKNKSTAMKILAKDWYGDNVPLGADSKKVIEQTTDVWINEAAELHGWSKTKVEQFKSFLSRQTDVARMSYDRRPTRQPRQSVFVGTTNSEHYLTDPTGNRRIWPVKIAQFDLEALRRDVDQIWAEAVVREAAGVSIHLDESLWGAAAVQQEARVEQHPFVDMFADALGSLRGKFKCADAWIILDLQPGQRTQPNQTAVGTSLRSLGWQRFQRSVNGEQRWYYVKGGHPERLIEVKRDTAPGKKLTLTYAEHREEKFVQTKAPF
jgi:hypothetical protein